MASPTDGSEAVGEPQGGTSEWSGKRSEPPLFVPLMTSFDASAFEREAARHLKDQLGVSRLTLHWRDDYEGRQEIHHSGAGNDQFLALVKRALSEDQPCLGNTLGKGVEFALSHRFDDCVAAVAGLIPGGWITRGKLKSHAVQILRAACASGAQFGQLEILRQQLQRQTKTEKLQRALYAIADMASSELDMPDMLAGLHQIVDELMYAENLFIALHNPEQRTMRFIYHSDTVDTTYTDTDREIPESELENSLTLAMIKHGKPLMGPSEKIRGMFDIPFDPAFGPNAKDWLGVPMISGSVVRGAIVVQSYDEKLRYSDQDRDLLSFVGQHILTALDRKKAYDELEERVAQRTRDLEQANRVLYEEAEKRKHGERLQAALYRIAELTNAPLSLEAFCREIHRVVGELVEAKNLFIALISEDNDYLEFPYAADEHDTNKPHFRPRKIGHGLTEYVLKRSEPVLLSKTQILEMRDEQMLQWHGTDPESWMGAPLISDEKTVGVLAVQSYARGYAYQDSDLDLLTFVSHHIATALARKEQSENLRAAYDKLEQRVRNRTRALAETNEELQQQVERLGKAEQLQSALFAIADMASANLDMPEMLARVHQRIGELMYAQNFGIVLNDERSNSIRFLYFADVLDADGPELGVDIPKSEIPNSLTLALIEQGRPLMGPSRELCEQFGIAQHNQHGPDALDWLGVPMLSGDEVRGALVVQSYDAGQQFSAEDRDLLQFVAHHILTAVERRQARDLLERRVVERTEALGRANTELTEEVKRRQQGEELQATLFRIAELASTQISLESFYEEVHRIVGGLLSAKNFFIALLSDSGEEISFPYSRDEREPEGYSTRPLSKGLTEYVLRKQKVLRASREQIDALMQSGEVSSIGSKSLSWLGVPLTDEGKILGVIAVQSYSPEVVYSRRHQELLTFVSFHIATALRRRRQAESLQRAYGELERRVTERTRELAETNAELREQIAVRREVEQQLQHDALHDSLTDLPNRALLLDRLSHILRRYQRDQRNEFAVLFLDLDRFKVVNDSVGHLVGDELLKEAGLRIAGCLRESDTVARLGGDEFAILLEQLDTPGYAGQVAERVISALDEPFRVAGKELFSSASIGIALAHQRYRHAEELLRDADVAMYRAKGKGRHRYELFDERLHEQALRLLDLENDLRRAVTRGEFEPHYQPIVRLADGHVVGFEALMRWRHPQRGLLLPEEFLHVAEDTGHVDEIDWQVYEQVCAEARQLIKGGRYISINVSARHFHRDDLDRKLTALFKTNNLPRDSVRIEVTEGALLENPEHIRTMLTRLREAGVRTHIDDFGTGYSSLSYLHRFPLHGVKIDREFVADLTLDGERDSAPIVRAIRALAHSLDMEVIAEGIESTAQRDALITLGCPVGQGFLFAQPLPRERLP